MDNVINLDQNAEFATEQQELTPLIDMFEDAKEMFVMTVETNIITAKRIDYLMWIRDKVYQFWGNMLDEKFIEAERMDYYHSMHEICLDTYRRIAGIAKTFEYEEFCKEEMKDYFEGNVDSYDAALENFYKSVSEKYPELSY